MTSDVVRKERRRLIIPLLLFVVIVMQLVLSGRLSNTRNIDILASFACGMCAGVFLSSLARVLRNQP